MEKMHRSDYSISMSYRDIDLPVKRNLDGQDIHKVISGVHLDYEDAKKSRRDIELTIYYRDLLSFLIKTSGH